VREGWDKVFKIVGLGRKSMFPSGGEKLLELMRIGDAPIRQRIITGGF